MQPIAVLAPLPLFIFFKKFSAFIISHGAFFGGFVRVRLPPTPNTPLTAPAAWDTVSPNVCSETEDGFQSLPFFPHATILPVRWGGAGCEYVWNMQGLCTKVRHIPRFYHTFVHDYALLCMFILHTVNSQICRKPLQSLKFQRSQAFRNYSDNHDLRISCYFKAAIASLACSGLAITSV